MTFKFQVERNTESVHLYLDDCANRNMEKFGMSKMRVSFNAPIIQLKLKETVGLGGMATF